VSTEMTFTNNKLTIEVTESSDRIVFTFKGKSVDRDPGNFLTPLIQEGLNRAQSKTVELNFIHLEYMNSSTVTPIIKLLNEVEVGKQTISIVYAKQHKWQELSFSALKIFQTRDKRIEVVGQ
jgi:hypothetical protein